MGGGGGGKYYSLHEKLPMNWQDDGRGRCAPPAG